MGYMDNSPWGLICSQTHTMKRSVGEKAKEVGRGVIGTSVMQRGGGLRGSNAFRRTQIA